MKNREIYIGKRQMHSAFILAPHRGYCQEGCNILFTAFSHTERSFFFLDNPRRWCYDCLNIINAMKRKPSSKAGSSTESGCRRLKAAAGTGGGPPPWSIALNAASR